MSKQPQTVAQRGAAPAVGFNRMGLWRKCIFIAQFAVFLATWGFVYPNVLDDN